LFVVGEEGFEGEWGLESEERKEACAARADMWRVNVGVRG
jgi:hypothetical protein